MRYCIEIWDIDRKGNPKLADVNEDILFDPDQLEAAENFAMQYRIQQIEDNNDSVKRYEERLIAHVMDEDMSDREPYPPAIYNLKYKVGIYLRENIGNYG